MKLHRILTLSGLATLTLLASACTSTNYKDITVETDANPETQFDGYQSYAWAVAAAALRDPDKQWTAPDLDVGAEITFLVNRELRERDLREVTREPDLLIMFGLGIDMKNMAMVTDDEHHTATLEQVPEGAVVIMITDPNTKRIVWVGSAKSGIDSTRALEETRDRLDWAISEMFDNSPF